MSWWSRALTDLSFWLVLLTLCGQYFSIDHFSVEGLTKEKHLPSNTGHRLQAAASILTCGFHTCSCSHLVFSFFRGARSRCLHFWRLARICQDSFVVSSSVPLSPRWFPSLSGDVRVLHPRHWRDRPSMYRRNRFSMGLTLFALASGEASHPWSSPIPHITADEVPQARVPVVKRSRNQSPGRGARGSSQERWYCPVVSCPDHDASSARGWSSSKTMTIWIFTFEASCLVRCPWGSGCVRCVIGWLLLATMVCIRGASRLLQLRLLPPLTWMFGTRPQAPFPEHCVHRFLSDSSFSPRWSTGSLGQVLVPRFGACRDERAWQDLLTPPGDLVSERCLPNSSPPRQEDIQASRFFVTSVCGRSKVLR